MHDGCLGNFSSGKEVLNKVRSMGFSTGLMPIPLEINCDCGHTFEMTTFESICPNCDMVYAVTPCHAFDAENVMKAGKKTETE